MRYNLQRLAMAASVVALVAACGGGTAASPGAGATAAASADASADASAASGKEKYTIYLSAVTIGNDWLQQMLRSPRLRSTKAPLAGRVNLTGREVENSEQAQINSLNNIIAPSRTRSSSTRLHRRRSTRPSKRACAAGIVVVSFSQVVTAPCPYKVNTNWAHVNHDIPSGWPNVLGGKGKILVDEGLPGSPDLRGLEHDDRQCPGRSSRASRSSATTSRTTRSATRRRASRACSPRTPRSTAS